MSFAASLVIPTRNRVPELRKLLHSARAQTVPLEVLVMDDGDDDTVGEVVRREFQTVRYHRLGPKRGPAFQRNRGIEMASANIVFPLDDDTEFVSRGTIEQTLAEFNNPRVGAVGIPYINIAQNENVQQRAPSTTETFVTHAFVGASHAVRRTVFQLVGGYREHFFYMGEEGDLCLRLLSFGYVTRVGNADPIHHFESPARNLASADYYGRRNDVLFAWHNTPAGWLLPHLLMTSVSAVRQSLATGSAFHLRGLTSGYIESIRRWRERKPASNQIYRLHRRLKKAGPLRLKDVCGILHAL